MPPPDSFSPSPRSLEKFEPVPEPYLNRRASRTHRSMMPPSFTRSSEIGLDEAGVRLRMLVGRFGFGQLAGERIDVIVALAGAVDAVGPVQAGVEPLRRIRRAHLRGQHVAQLIEERLRIRLLN